jgi:protein-tyrosine-phosphatase
VGGPGARRWAPRTWIRQRAGSGEGEARTLGDFAAGGEGLGDAVPDPFGGPEAVYEETYHELRVLVAAALDRLEPILRP